MDRFFGRFAWGALLLGAILLSVAGYLANGAAGFVARAQVAAGTVVELEPSSSGDSVTYHPVVSYRLPAGGEQRLRGSVGSSPPAYRVGEAVEVLYDPGNPQDARLGSVFSLWGAPLVLSILGAAFGGIGGIMLLVRRGAARREEELRRSGTRVQARFQCVERNMGLEVNGRHPWRIVCQWQDPTTGLVHLLKSKNLWVDPTPFVQQGELTVFVDRANPKRHVMDVGFLPKVA